MPTSTPTPSPPPESSSIPPRKYTLAAEHELRFETPSDGTKDVTLTLEHGSAEIFGIELALNRPYHLPPGLKAAAFTWHGAALSLSAPTSVMAYTAGDTPMPTYISAHAVLQSRRESARLAGIAGPKAVVVGPRDCGKSSLVGILAAYCVRQNGGVVVVDADPGGGGVGLGVPGGVGISLVKRLDLEAGGLMHQREVCWMVGHEQPGLNLEVSARVFEGVGEVLDGVLAKQDWVGFGGCVVDTAGEVEGGGVKGVVRVVEGLKADVVFVLGAERFFAEVKKELEGGGVETVLVGKSGGVVSRGERERMGIRARRIKEYFYGADNRLSPFSTVVDFKDVVVLKVGGVVSVVPDSALPIGARSTLDALTPCAILKVRDVLHRVLGVSQAEREEEVLMAGLFGFVHVVKVDEERNTMTVLAPSPGTIPSKFLVAGETKWIE